jgi:uncharacterized protein (DUF885 family)
MLGLAMLGMVQSVAVADASADLERIVEPYFDTYLERNPLAATFIGDHRYDDRLAIDIAPEYVASTHEFEQHYLDRARAIDTGPLDAADRLTLQIFRREREMRLAELEFPEHLLPVSQIGGLQQLMPVFGSGDSAQPFDTVEDYEQFLARVDDFVVWIDQAIANMRTGLERGVTNPRSVMRKVLPQLEAMIVQDPAQSVFYGPVRSLPAGFAPADKARLEAAYREAISAKIVPAYAKLERFVRDDYLPKARTSVGWSELPGGAAWYAELARAYTTTSLEPAQIHEIGLEEVARILREMDAVRRQVGFEGDLDAFFTHLETDPQFYFERPDELIDGYRALKRRIDALLPRLFADFPKADYEVRPVEPFRAQSAAGAFYQQPSEDGSQPGIFYINTYNLKAQPKYGMETLSLHEAAPGHHFQIAIQQERDDLPRFRRFGRGYVAYSEGWALYAESIGKELGLFADPYQYYGRLSDEMLRAMRLVVDTGLHAFGWSRERAIEYMLANSTLAESDVVAEVERYIANPGQALGYKIGQLRITAMRARAEAALGDSFDVRAFHSTVLRTGAVPIDILEARIDEWIAARRPRATAYVQPAGGGL